MVIADQGGIVEQSIDEADATTGSANTGFQPSKPWLLVSTIDPFAQRRLTTWKRATAFDGLHNAPNGLDIRLLQRSARIRARSTSLARSMRS